ncbi:Spi family protease inhibitor, partial [Bacteroides xylanisolvens]
MSFFCETIRSRGGIPRLQLVWDGESTTTRGGSSPAFYVFNRMDSDGFVIISGDDVTMPILGYSCSNHFVVENMPPNLLDWMDELRNQINAVREEHVVGTSYISKAWTRASDAIGTPIVKLTTALWDQQAPFNRLSPTTSDGKSITGCVATAMAIIMQYYQWPDQGVGTVPVYTLQADKNTQIPSKT